MMKWLNSATLSLIFISNFAFAQTAPAADPMKSILINLPPILLLFALFYFGLIRPQRNQQKRHADFITKLSKGDEVVTASGIIGIIKGMNDRVITLEISEGTEIKILKSQIQGYLKDNLQTTAPTKA